MEDDYGNEDAPYERYRAHVQSVSGMYAQYSGYVDVWVKPGDSLLEAAVKELRRTSFPDRGAAHWRLVRVEKIQR